MLVTVLPPPSTPAPEFRNSKYAKGSIYMRKVHADKELLLLKKPSKRSRKRNTSGDKSRTRAQSRRHHGGLTAAVSKS